MTPTKKKIAIGGGAVALVAALGGAGLWWRRKRNEENDAMGRAAAAETRAEIAKMRAAGTLLGPDGKPLPPDGPDLGDVSMARQDASRHGSPDAFAGASAPAVATGDPVAGTDDAGADVEGVVLSVVESGPVVVYEVRDPLGRVHHVPRHRIRRHFGRPWRHDVPLVLVGEHDRRERERREREVREAREREAKARR